MEVSIIMPYYNAAKYIKETVTAIINQTYKDWELIIVDDCSTSSDTGIILREIQSFDARIKILRTEKNGGAGIARNVGIKAAEGRYLAFCDSDDWWYPTKLEEQLHWMRNNNYTFTCTWYEDANENLEPYYIMKQKTRNNYKNLISGCNIGTPGVIIDIQKLGKKYMPVLRQAEDWGLWMMYLKEVDYIYTYPKALWKYRHIPKSETSNKLQQLKSVMAMYQNVLGFSCLKSLIICILFFLPQNIWKKIKKYIL